MRPFIALTTLLVIPLAAVTAAELPAPRAKVDPAAVFKTLDKDEDGFLSFKEWSDAVLGQIDAPHQPLIFKAKDVNLDGKLSLEEFIHVPPPPKGEKTAKKVKKQK